MATSRKILDDGVREKYLAILAEVLSAQGEEVLRVGSNEIALPCVDAESNDKFVVLTVKVPTGSRDGDLYDGYSMAEDYELKQKAKAEKAAKDMEAKAKKKARDEKQRQQAAEIKAKKEAAAKGEGGA